MSEIKKNKGMIEFWIDGKAKPYVLDINKCQLLGLRGGVLQNIPTAVRSLARGSNTTVGRLIYNNYCLQGNSSLYLMADKLDSIGYTATIWELNQYSVDLANMDFRKLARFIQQERANGHTGGGMIEDYIVKCHKEEWATKVGLQADEMLTKEMIEFIYRDYRNEEPKTQRMLAYYLSRGAWEYYYDDSRYSLRAKINNMLSFARELQVDLEKGDFFRQYINLHRAYVAKKDEIANRKMAEYQEYRRNALTFETNTHIVIIPTTVEELRIEGSKQGNCVGGYGARIGEKDRNVVFIRRKTDPTKSYITCDILSNGSINQYLAARNSYVRNEQDLEFERLYQAHLYDNWGE